MSLYLDKISSKDIFLFVQSIYRHLTYLEFLREKFKKGQFSDKKIWIYDGVDAALYTKDINNTRSEKTKDYQSANELIPTTMSCNSIRIEYLQHQWNADPCRKVCGLYVYILISTLFPDSRLNRLGSYPG